MADTSLPRLTGQWIDLVKLVGPVQLPPRPKQMIDSYCTIWQKGDQLWAGDGFGSVNAEGVVTMYDQKALYVGGEIVWPGEQGLNAYIRTVDLAGAWADEDGRIHDLAQKYSPVEMTQEEPVLGQDRIGSITGHHLKFSLKENNHKLSGHLSKDCFTILWSDGSVWKRHLHLQGDWISIKNKDREIIQCDETTVSIGGIPGAIDLSNWYVTADSKPFPDNKTKGGIDLDSTAIHWTDYIGWQRVFEVGGIWKDASGAKHTISNQRIQDPTEYRRFIWLFDGQQGEMGTLIRNWVELTSDGKTRRGQINFDASCINWEDGDVWGKQ